MIEALFRCVRAFSFTCVTINAMRKITYALSLIAVLGAAVYIPAFAQYTGPPGGGAQTATPEQLKQCTQLGIPQFACTENTILAKERVTEAQKSGAYGSGTAMLGGTFGEMGTFVVIIGAIFGSVAAAFFVMSRKKKEETVIKSR